MSKNKPMKRLDETEVQGSEPSVPVAPNPVMSVNGAIYVVDKDDIDSVLNPPEEPKPQTEPNVVQATAPVRKTSIIAVDANPTDEMEEIPFTTFIKTKEAAIAQEPVALTTTDKLKALIGTTVDAAKLVLEDLKAKRILSNYRFVPIGQPVTMDLQPGRVQIMVDHQKNVIDVNIS